MPAQRRYQRKPAAVVRSRQGSQTGTAPAVLGKPGAACELGSTRPTTRPTRKSAQSRRNKGNASKWIDLCERCRVRHGLSSWNITPKLIASPELSAKNTRIGRPTSDYRLGYSTAE